MEFAAVNTQKSAAKTVAITLTNEESKNPANAFSALLNLTGTRFKAEHGLSTVEGQWLRARPQTDQDLDAKPKHELEAKPKDKARDDNAATDDADDVSAPAKAKDETKESSANDNRATQATGETQPTEQAAAVGLEAVQAVAIQFQILVQLPTGELKDMGTFDLQTLLAAASQDASLAGALEAAFSQAANSLENGQSLLDALAQTSAGNNALTGAQLLSAGETTVEGADAQGVADLFKQIAAVLHPLAQQTSEAGKTVAADKRLTANLAAGDAQVEIDIAAPEAAKQSAELSRILGDDNKIRIQVVVAGRQVADLPFEWGQFNRYVGYNPEAMRNAAVANGMQGVNSQAANAQGEATLTQPMPFSTAPAASTAAPTQSAVPGGGAPRAEPAPVRGAEAPAQQSSNSGSNNTQNQSTSFANTLNQSSSNAATGQASGAERTAQTPQQVIEQIKVNITRAAKAGLDRVTIQLRPEELGRIEIKLEMSQDGKVRAAITADNPATLELLQREARGLERALLDAGLRADASNLEFNLRGEGQDRLSENSDSRGQRGQGQGGSRGQAEAEALDEETYDYTLAARMRGGVDTYA
ncbi:MAG: flagellar hook-length control protein FliK [Rhodospirillaceae bacterium]|nr:flagellar hook-length control protein FliK [Rhodospirillaceae bacterium]